MDKFVPMTRQRRIRDCKNWDIAEYKPRAETLPCKQESEIQNRCPTGSAIADRKFLWALNYNSGMELATFTVKFERLFQLSRERLFENNNLIPLWLRITLARCIGITFTNGWKKFFLWLAENPIVMARQHLSNIHFISNANNFSVYRELQPFL